MSKEFPRFKAICNGIELGRGENGNQSIVEYVRGNTTTLNFVCIDPATNLPYDLSSDTVTLKVYEDYRKRKYAEGGPLAGSTTGVLASKAAAASTSGVAVVTIADTETGFSTLTIYPRKNYYAELEIVDSSDSNAILKSMGFEFKVK